MGNDENKSSRDHLYSDANVPLYEWIFLLENLKNDKEMCKSLEHLIPHCGIVETEIIQAIIGFKQLLVSKIIQLSRLKD